MGKFESESDWRLRDIPGHGFRKQKKKGVNARIQGVHGRWQLQCDSLKSAEICRAGIEMRVAQISLSVAQNISVECMNLATCSDQNRMARSDIPLHSASQSGIEVSFAFCNQTNFER